MLLQNKKNADNLFSSNDTYAFALNNNLIVSKLHYNVIITLKNEDFVSASVIQRYKYVEM